MSTTVRLACAGGMKMTSVACGGLPPAGWVPAPPPVGGDPLPPMPVSCAQIGKLLYTLPLSQRNLGAPCQPGARAGDGEGCEAQSRQVRMSKKVYVITCGARSR